MHQPSLSLSKLLADVEAVVAAGGAIIFDQRIEVIPTDTFVEIVGQGLPEGFGWLEYAAAIAICACRQHVVVFRMEVVDFGLAVKEFKHLFIFFLFFFQRLALGVGQWFPILVHPVLQSPPSLKSSSGVTAPRTGPTPFLPSILLRGMAGLSVRSTVLFG